MGPLGDFYTTECKKSAFPPGTPEPISRGPRQRVSCPGNASAGLPRRAWWRRLEDPKGFDKCRIRLSCPLVFPPRVRHLLAHFFSSRRIRRTGSSVMIGLVRAAILCATLSLGLISAGLPLAQAADKPFKRDDLADSAIKLEAQIKSEAGAVNKSSAALKADADAAFRRNDMRTG